VAQLGLEAAQFLLVFFALQFGLAVFLLPVVFRHRVPPLLELPGVNQFSSDFILKGRHRLPQRGEVSLGQRERSQSIDKESH